MRLLFSRLGKVDQWSATVQIYSHPVWQEDLVPWIGDSGELGRALQREPIPYAATLISTTTGRLIAAGAAFLAGWLPLLALLGPYAATFAVIVPGAFLTVVVACAYVTTDALTPAGRTSEAYAWLILSIGAGQSAVTALAEHPFAATALPAADAAFTLTVLLAARPHRTFVLGCV
ncbi:hypothetical protein AB0A69_13915 [Streptomyces sp. NPDC045431]|uniref:hypothetical protein n=1 Tax=Streptomyces sp. NPDC045431 TaxID=3155613 RepID=UPI0033C8BBCB